MKTQEFADIHTQIKIVFTKTRHPSDRLTSIVSKFKLKQNLTQDETHYIHKKYSKLKNKTHS